MSYWVIKKHNVLILYIFSFKLFLLRNQLRKLQISCLNPHFTKCFVGIDCKRGPFLFYPISTYVLSYVLLRIWTQVQVIVVNFLRFCYCCWRSEHKFQKIYKLCFKTTYLLRSLKRSEVIRASLLRLLYSNRECMTFSIQGLSKLSVNFLKIHHFILSV